MNNTQRTIITRIVISYILLFLVLRFIEHLTPSRLLAPPLFHLQLDISYWLYKLSGIPSLIIYNKTGAILFDLLMFGTGLLSLIFPLQRKWLIPFSVFLFIYAISFNTFVMHHTHSNAGLMIVLFPFWFADNTRFFLLWQGIRYYTCFLYFTSFAWKLVKGSFFNWQQGIGTFKVNMAEYIYHNPDNVLSGFYRYCIRHDWLLNAGNIILALMEGMMIIGFFTKKMDRLLFWIPVTIHVVTYFFSDVLFFELLVLDFSLLSGKKIEAIGHRIPILTRQTGVNTRFTG